MPSKTLTTTVLMSGAALVSGHPFAALTSSLAFESQMLAAKTLGANPRPAIANTVAIIRARKCLGVFMIQFLIICSDSSIKSGSGVSLYDGVVNKGSENFGKGDDNKADEGVEEGVFSFGKFVRIAG